MSYNVSFISLGCAKNQVNCEQMMALCAEAGYSIQAQPEGCDVVVVNTCGFLASACEEAIENILEMAELKKAGQVKKILVTGCMTQRYKEDIFHELPEVDGLLGTGSYGDIATAIAEVMEKGEKPCHLGNIHTANQSGERILSTPPWYAYLRIAEGCDNHCAYCVIPSLRGNYRSRRMEDILEELVGEIWDEHDEVTEDFRQQSDGSWLVSGSASVDDLYEELDLPEEEDIDSNTVNGLVQEKTCHLPKVGDRFTLGSYDGVVTRTAKRRVTEVRLTPEEKPEPKKEEDEKPHFNRLTNK